MQYSAHSGIPWDLVDPEQRPAGSQNSAFHSLTHKDSMQGMSLLFWLCTQSCGQTSEGHLGGGSICCMGAFDLIIPFMSGLEGSVPLLSCTLV